MAGGLELDQQRQLASPDGGQKFFAGLDRALGPAMLLRLEAVHVDRQLRRRNDIRQENELPAGQLRAITEVEIFGQRVVLPATGFFDAGAPPKSGRAVEIEET